MLSFHRGVIDSIIAKFVLGSCYIETSKLYLNSCRRCDFCYNNVLVFRLKHKTMWLSWFNKSWCFFRPRAGI